MRAAPALARGLAPLGSSCRLPAAAAAETGLLGATDQS